MIRARRATRAGRAIATGLLASSLVACSALVGVDFDSVTLRDAGVDPGESASDAQGGGIVTADGAACCTTRDAVSPNDAIASADATEPPSDSSSPVDSSPPVDSNPPDDSAPPVDANDGATCLPVGSPCTTDPECCSDSCDPFFGCMDAVDASPPVDAAPPKDATPPKDASPPKDAAPPKDSAPPEDSAPPVDSAPPEDATGDACLPTGTVCSASTDCCSGQCLPAPFSECL
jgi:hypothetical protein